MDFYKTLKDGNLTSDDKIVLLYIWNIQQTVKLNKHFNDCTISNNTNIPRKQVTESIENLMRNSYLEILKLDGFGTIYNVLSHPTNIQKWNKRDEK